ncbi:MAG: glycosyltransferase family 4 protein [Rickettsiaceae bacterium]|nr:glycosyltransferase family 4 protein [Rickettsiaceae bacterium]
MTGKKNIRKRTFLQVVPSLVSGGVERGTLEVAKRIVASGYNSVVISNGGSMVDRLLAEGSTHIKLPVHSKTPFIIWQNSVKIAKLIKEQEVDIIHARSRAPAWSSFLAAKNTGIKFVTTFHGIYNFNNVLKKYYNSIMTKGNLVIAVSNFVKNHITDNYLINSDKITVIYRGVDHTVFSKNNLSINKMNKLKVKYQVPNNIPILLLPSRMTNWKGQLVLIEALNKLNKEQNLEFYTLLIGDCLRHPNYVSRLRQLVDDYSLQEKIGIFDSQLDMLNLYGIADIVVSTSIEPEAFGRTIIEAQSMEKLVISTNIGGAAETIIDGKTGFHVEPNNSEQLAEKLLQCLAILNTNVANSITKAARSNVLKHFSLDSMLSSTMLAYEQLLS